MHNGIPGNKKIIIQSIPIGEIVVYRTDFSAQSDNFEIFLRTTGESYVLNVCFSLIILE